MTLMPLDLNVSTVLAVWGRGLHEAGDVTHQADLDDLDAAVMESNPDSSDIDRLLMTVDFLTRSYAPKLLDRAGLVDLAENFRAVSKIHMIIDFIAILPVLVAAQAVCESAAAGLDPEDELAVAATLAQKALGWAVCTGVNAKNGPARLAAGEEIIRHDVVGIAGDQSLAGQVFVLTRDPRFADLVAPLQEEVLAHYRKLTDPEELIRFKMSP